MHGLAVIASVFLVASGLAEPIGIRMPEPKKVDDPVLLTRQKNLIELYYHISEPMFFQEKDIAATYKLSEHVDKYDNVTAVKMAVTMIEGGWTLLRSVPFSIQEPFHRFEAVTYFHVLYSAKDFETFYKTAVYFRQHVNEYLFTYVLNVAIYHRSDTQGMFVPPLYEVFPSFFNNAEIMTTARRVGSHHQNYVEHYSSTYLWDDNVVIRWNATVWPYYVKETSVAYYTHDFGLNEYYLNDHLAYPFWLGGETTPLIKDKRGERFWFNHKQYLSRYYMERLSSGLGEIPILGLDDVESGYTSGLMYSNGIIFPVRPDYFSLKQPWFVEAMEEITEYETRIRSAIDMGYIMTPSGEKINIRNPEALDILGRIIEANVDSPNSDYYKDFISIWKSVLGNSITHKQHRNGIPLVNPSPLELYQTTLRDPAFYMIWKRVMRLFTYWQQKLPHYTREELSLPGVTIKHVEFDKLLTYFEYAYMNVTSSTYFSQEERVAGYDKKSVLVQHQRLNHKDFSVRLIVNSEAAKNINVKFFLAPKYDSHGNEILLQDNTDNFFLLDTFLYSLTEGENVIVRNCTDNVHISKDLDYSWSVYKDVEDALNGHGQFYRDPRQKIGGFPKRLILPRGRVGGMPFVVMVYISEYRAPNVLYGTGYDAATSPGIGSGARKITSYPLGYPVDRPLYEYQVSGLKNFWLEDVQIYHKITSEMQVPYFG